MYQQLNLYFHTTSKPTQSGSLQYTTSNMAIKTVQKIKCFTKCVNNHFHAIPAGLFISKTKHYDNLTQQPLATHYKLTQQIKTFME